MDYAEYIGINLEEDEDLLYLAKEGLKAPLPADWKPCQNREGKIYYFNFKTKQSQWEHPCDEHYKKLYQEAKKKKQQRAIEKPIVNKPRSSVSAIPPMPIKKAPLSKQDPLPSLKTNPVSSRSNQPSYETSFNVDNLAAYALNHQNSGSNDNIREMSSFIEKKSEEKSQPVEFENFWTLGSESAIPEDNDILEDDDDDEDKIAEYQVQKQEEVDRLKDHLKEEENKLEKDFQKKLKDELQVFKDELSENAQKGARGKLIQEKESIRTTRKAEFKKKTDEEIKKVEREYSYKKRELEASQNKKLREEKNATEDQVKEEYETKRAARIILQCKSDNI